MCSTGNVTIINFDEPRHDQDTYWGRARNLFILHNPLHIFTCPDTMEEARCLYLKHRCGEPLPDDIDEEELWRAKRIYESAHNTETGEEINFLARPAASIPMDSLLAGGMMAYYNSTLGVVLWQWLNQTYNTFVSYENRGGDVPCTDNQLITSYIIATGTAVATALGLNKLMRAPPTSLVRRFVPLAAVAAAHCASAPLMRAQMLKNGAPIFDDADNKLGYSKRAAEAGITGVILNRILWAVPPMVLTPLLMHQLEKRGTLCRYPWINFPAHVAIAGFCLTCISPLVRAMLPAKSSLPSKHLEPEMRDYLCKKYYDRPPKYIYYNNGY